MSRGPYLLGLVGSGIGRSLTPAMQEREGREAGLQVSYRLIDSEVHGFDADDLPELLRWAQRLGYDGLNVTHPFKQAVVPLLDELSDEAADLGAVNTVVLPGRPDARPQHRLSGFGRAFAGSLPDAVGDPAVLVGAGGAGVAVGYALLEGRRRPRGDPRQRHRARGRVRRTPGEAIRRRPGRRWPRTSSAHWPGRDGLVNATPVGMHGHPGVPVPAELVRAGPVGVRHRVLPAGDRAGRAGAQSRVPGDAGRRDGGAAGRRGLRATSPADPADAARMGRHFEELTA